MAPPSLTDPMTPEEAETFLGSAASIMSQMEERERARSSAIPRDICTCGELDALLAALVVLIALRFPQLVEDEGPAVDLHSMRYRTRN